ncbi:MAG: hypothetical protein ACLQDQ_05215 [Myxococcaceae bacterium]
MPRRQTPRQAAWRGRAVWPWALAAAALLAGLQLAPRLRAFPVAALTTPQGAVEGQVVDEAGRPVAGALVRGQPFDIPAVHSDAQGRFRLPEVPEGVDYQLVAVLENATSAPRQARAGERQLRLLLPVARRYRGRVLDEAGVPVPAFRVGPLEVEAADGRFELTLRPARDTVSFAVEAPRLAMATLVRPADKEDVGDIVLRAAPAVHGTVREANGKPAPFALVVCEGCRGEAAGERHLTAVADGEGHFSLSVTGPYGVLVRLLAKKEGRVGWAEAGRAGEAPLLTLAEPAAVTGRVRRPDGAAAARVGVVFSDSLLEPVLLVTGADGSFSGSVPPGLYQVTLKPDASSPRRTWTVQVPREGSLELVTGAVP